MQNCFLPLHWVKSCHQSMQSIASHVIYSRVITGSSCSIVEVRSKLAVLTKAGGCLQLRMYRVVWFYRWCEYSSNIRLLWLTLFRNMSVSLMLHTSTEPS